MDSIATPLPVLIVGLGSIGERHLRCFQSSGSYSVSGCELNPEVAKSVSDRYACPVFGSLDEALASQKYRAAVICTLANTHIPIAAKCVENGLHVLIEKPLALTTDGIAELASLAETKGLIVRVAYTGRSLILARELKQMVDSGRAGEIRHVSSVAGQHFPTFRPAYRTIYYRSHETGGGAIQDALTHQIHNTEWLIGPFKRVFASSAHQVLPGVEVEDTVVVTAATGDGILASFSFNQFQFPNETFIQLNGTLGSFRWEIHRSRIGFFHRDAKDWDWTEAEAEERDGSYIRQAEYFRDELNGKPTPLATLEEGLQTLKVNQAALESARNHMEMHIS